MTKFFLYSKTIQGLLILAIPFINLFLKQFGYDVVIINEDITGFFELFLGLAGFIYSFVGRLKAKEQLSWHL